MRRNTGNAFIQIATTVSVPIPLNTCRSSTRDRHCAWERAAQMRHLHVSQKGALNDDFLAEPKSRQPTEIS